MDAMLRIGDWEPSRVVEASRTHTGPGRLSLDEFSQRSRRAYAARARGELDEVLADLPRPGAGESPRTLLWVLGVALLAVLFLVGFAGLAQLLS